MAAKQPSKDYAARAREMVRASSPQSTRSSRPAPPGRSAVREFIGALLFAAVAALFLKTFVVEAFRIPTGSMETTLRVGDFLLVNKFLYSVKTPSSIPFTSVRLPHYNFGGMRAPQRGDVIVFEWPGTRDEIQDEEVTNYIKRCVGLPGDTVEVRNKVLFTNGTEFFRPPGMQFMTPVPEPRGRRDPAMFPLGMPWNRDNYGPLRIPKRGDVVPISSANIQQWETFIKREGHAVETHSGTVTIDGAAATTYTVERNDFFMMGDNRDNSEDSRFWGFVPEDNIVGPAMIVYWSWDPSVPFTNLVKLISTTRWNRIFQIIH